jgi:hypothetical protein
VRKHRSAPVHPHPHVCMQAHTHTHTDQHVILIAFPLQQRLREHASMLRYTTYIACLVKPFHSLFRAQIIVPSDSLRVEIFCVSDPSGRAVSGEGLRPIICWNCGFEYRLEHTYLSLVSVVCLSGRDLCDGPIPRPEETYRLWCVIVCDLETSRLRRPWAALGCCTRGKENCHGTVQTVSRYYHF